MINTLDGKKLKRGEKCFVVAITIDDVHVPLMCKVHSRSPDYFVPDETKVYASREECQKKCDEKNLSKTHKPKQNEQRTIHSPDGETSPYNQKIKL